MKNQTHSSTRLINTQLAVCENLVNKDDITIREFLVYQNSQSSGEFDGTSVCYKNPIDLAEESSEHLLSRMMLHFHHVCMRAREVHIQQNFAGYDVDDSDVNKAIPVNANAITRVVFNEFSFYPYQKRGPLTFDDLNVFCEKLVEAASEYPANMHMCIASVPVCDKNNNVFNVGIYLQCGSEVRINVFAKAAPDVIDPLYDGTNNACYAAIINSDSYIKEVRSASNKLIDQLRVDDPVAISVAIDNLLNALGSSPDYLLDKKNQIDRNVEIIKNRCIKIIDHIHDRGAYYNFKILTDIDNAVMAYTRAIEASDDKKYMGFKDWAKAAPMPQANVAYHDESGRVIYRGGLIECVTAGGVAFITTIDICFDNCIDVAVKLYQRYLENCLRDNKLITPYLSYIITSNTIEVDVWEQLCDIVVQCDVNYTSIQYKAKDAHLLMPAHHEMVAETAFGSTATIEAYHPYALKKLTNELRGRIEYYNKMIQERRALALQVKRLPHLAANVQRLDEVDLRSLVHLMPPKMTVKYVLGLLLPEIRQKLDDDVHPFTAADFITALDKIDDFNLMVLGNSLLQWSITNNIDGIVDVIVGRKGVNLSVANAQGYTAFDLAVMYNRKEIAIQLYGLLIETDRKTITSSQLIFASKELKAALLTAAIEAERLSDVKYFLGVGADLFLMNNFVKPVDKVAKHFSEALFETIYHHVKLSNQLNLFSVITLYNFNNKARVLLIELCCCDRLDQEVDFIFKMQTDLVLTTSDIQRLHQLIDLNNGSELSHLVKMHLNALGHQSHFLDKLVENEQVKPVAPLAPF